MIYTGGQLTGWPVAQLPVYDVSPQRPDTVNAHSWCALAWTLSAYLRSLKRTDE
jgi:hypothetical protein